MIKTACFHVAGLTMLLLVPVTSGCEGTECGPGTREQGGLCVPISLLPGDGAVVHCGTNTFLVGNECVPAQTLCGEFTEVQMELDDQGNPTGGFICVGKPQDVEENPPPECPTTFGPSGEICINGWVHWLMDEESGTFLLGRMSDPETTEATSMAVKVYDPLLYAQDPATAQPIGVGEVNPKFGTFRVTDVAIPSNGIIALVADDLDDGVQDRWVLTGSAYGAVPNENILGVVAFAVSQEQNQAWTTAVGGESHLASLGCATPPGGAPHTIASCGTWVAIYASSVAADEIIGVEGVGPLMPGGPVPADRTFFPGISEAGELVFDDPAPGVVWSDDLGPHEWTGILGSVFYPSASLQNMNGVCGTGTPCSNAVCLWSEVLGGSVAGAIFVQFVFPITCNE